MEGLVGLMGFRALDSQNKVEGVGFLRVEEV